MFAGGTSLGHCCLVEGTRQKNYRPLLERPFCESLESRINHFVKRGRLQLEGGENGEETIQRAKKSKRFQNSPPGDDVPADQPAGGADQKTDDWCLLAREWTTGYMQYYFKIFFYAKNLIYFPDQIMSNFILEMSQVRLEYLFW